MIRGEKERRAGSGLGSTPATTTMIMTTMRNMERLGGRGWAGLILAGMLAGCGEPASEGPAATAEARAKTPAPPLDLAPVTAAVSEGKANALWRFAVSGMHCEDCAKGIKSELLRVPGVVAAQVGLAQAQAAVAVDTNRVTVGALEKLVADSGYEAKPIQP